MRFEITLTPILKAQIDEWRRRHPEIPNRASAARLLIEAGLANGTAETVQPA